MHTVFVLIDHPNLDYLLVPVIEELKKTGTIHVVSCVCNDGNTELLEKRNIPYNTDVRSFNLFVSRPGKKLFLNAADMNYPEYQLGWELDDICRKKGIPSLSVEHAAHSMYGKLGRNAIVNADRIAIAGSCEFDEYRELGVSSEKLVITGCPKYDEYVYLLNETDSGRTYVSEKTKKEKGQILLVGANHGPVKMVRSHSEEQWVNVLKKVFGVLEKRFKNADIVIKPHPAETYYDTVKLYENAIDENDKSRIKIIDPHSSIPHVILDSNFVLSFSPSVMLESMLLNTPVVLLSNLGNPESTIRPCEDEGAVIIRPDWSDIDRLLDNTLSEKVIESLSDIRPSDGFIERFVHRWDGKSSNRIAYLIVNMIEENPIALENGILVDWHDASVERRVGVADIESQKKPVIQVDNPMKDALPLVSIVIPVSGKLKYLKKCIKSIQQHTKTPYEILFVSSGAEKGALKWLKSVINEEKNFRLIKSERSLGSSGSWNKGIKNSLGDVIIFMHNDVVVSDGWLSGILENIRCNRNLGVFGPMTNNVEGPQRYRLPESHLVEDLSEKTRDFHERYRYRQIQVNKLEDFCFGVRRDVYERVGQLDDNFQSERYVLEDYCLRTRLEGYENVIVADILVYHYNKHKLAGSRKNEMKSIANDRECRNEKYNALNVDGSITQRRMALNAMEKAEMLWEKDRVNDAVDVMLKAIEEYPGETEVSYALSEILIDAGLYNEAIEVLNEIPSDIQDLKRLELTGYCEDGLEFYDDAASKADQVLDIEPSSAHALNLKGILEYKQGKKHEALTLFNEAIESSQYYGEPYTNIGFMRWNEGNIEEAIDYFEKGFVLTPNVTDIFQTYHSAVKSVCEFERAERAFQEACALYPNNKRMRFLLIDLLIAQNKNAEAMREIEEAMIIFGMDDGIIAAALEIRKSLGSMAIDKTTGDRGTTSLCMIVKDEEQNLAKCLLNLKPIIDEIIVVDTGSTDRTRDIALAFGSKVYDLDWSNDFSKARNYSISKASGDWIFVMDADEIISHQDYEVLKKIVNKRPSRPVSFSFMTRNYNMRGDLIGLNSNDGSYDREEKGVGWIPSDKVRLFTRGYNIHFEYPVHEIVEPFLKKKGIAIKKCSVPIHHYGQLEVDKRTCKGEEYYQIGMEKLNDMGEEDDVAIYELAVQAGMLEKWDEALELWQRFLKEKPDFPLAYVNMGTAYQNLGRFKEAAISTKRAMALAPDMREAFNDYALYQLFLGNSKDAVDILEKLIAKDPDYLSAQFKLAVAYSCHGRKKNGVEKLEKLKETDVGSGLCISCHTMAEKFVSIQRIDYAQAILEVAMESGNADQDVLALLRECHDHEAERQLFLKNDSNDSSGVVVSA